MKSHLAISKEFFNQLFTMGMTSSGNLRRAKKKKKKKPLKHDLCWLKARELRV
jgi:hypothetical protein